MELQEAIEILKEYRTGSYEGLKDIPKVFRAIDTVLAELDRQKQVKAEMRKVAWEEGYNQGYLAGIRAATLDEAGLDDEEE